MECVDLDFNNFQFNHSAYFRRHLPKPWKRPLLPRPQNGTWYLWLYHGSQHWKRSKWPTDYNLPPNYMFLTSRCRLQESISMNLVHRRAWPMKGLHHGTRWLYDLIRVRICLPSGGSWPILFVSCLLPWTTVSAPQFLHLVIQVRLIPLEHRWQRSNYRDPRYISNARLFLRAMQPREKHRHPTGPFPKSSNHAWVQRVQSVGTP